MTEDNRSVAVRPSGAVPQSAQTRALWASNLQNPEHVRALALVGQRYDLDPALGEIMVLGSKAYVTMEGFLRIAEREPTYDGYELRPANEEERRALKVTDDEHAWVASVFRKDRAHPSVGYGVASDRTVSAAPLRAYVREIAQKRALHRALRGAFRVQLPDPDEATELVTQGQPTPIRVVDAPDQPPKPPTPDWGRFWAEVKGITGLDNDHAKAFVHAVLGIESVTEAEGSINELLDTVAAAWRTEQEQRAGAEEYVDENGEILEAVEVPSVPADQPVPTFAGVGEFFEYCWEQFRIPSKQVLRELGFRSQGDLNLLKASEYVTTLRASAEVSQAR